MATVPAHISTPQHVPSSPDPRKTLSYTKEKTKIELFQAIEDQNVRHGDWQQKVEERYTQKVEKMKERGHDKKKAQELATKQIQKVRAKVWKDKLATPGTKGSGDFYKNVGDSDGEGAIFLIKKFIFGKKQSFTTYLKHEEIENYAQSSNLNDEKVLKIFLDGGGVPGVTVTSNAGKGLRSEWKQSKMVIDHHPEGPTSSTGMVAKLLELTHVIPDAEKKAVAKFVSTIDIVDSFLSKAGRAIHVEKDYAKTLCSLSYLLDSTELYKVCEQLPDDVGPLTPIPDNLLSSIEVKMKEKKDSVKLSECVAKKQANVVTGVTMLKEKLRAKQFVTIEGKKFIIFGPKDNISNDVRALLSAEHDYGTIKIHNGGEIFMVHDTGIPQPVRDLGLTVRDVIFLLNPKTAKNNHKDDLKKLCDMLPDGEGKTYMLSLLGNESKVRTQDLVSSKTVTPSPSDEGVVGRGSGGGENLASETKTPLDSSLHSEGLTTGNIGPAKGDSRKVESFTPVMKEIDKDFKQFGTSVKGLWSSFINSFKKGKPKT